MVGYCDIEINGKKYGALFGVRVFQVIKESGLKMDDDPNNVMNGIHTVWAGLKNNADLLGYDLDMTVKDLYIAINEDSKEYEKALECFAKSKIMGKPVVEVAEEVKKKTKKRSMLGRLYQKIVSGS